MCQGLRLKVSVVFDIHTGTFLSKILIYISYIFILLCQITAIQNASLATASHTEVFFTSDRPITSVIMMHYNNSALVTTVQNALRQPYIQFILIKYSKKNIFWGFYK